MVRAFVTGVRFQLTQTRVSYGDLVSVLTLPLFTVAFLAIVVEAGRADLAPHAVVGSALLMMWSTALHVSGEFVDSDRTAGTLEALMATPTHLAALVAGRVATTTMLSLAGFVESVLVAWLCFGIVVDPGNLAVLSVTLLTTAFAVAGTATLMSGLFVGHRGKQPLKNALSYPLYVLGGVVVPVAFLPDWLQPLSRLVFLSWAADLLRECVSAREVTAVPGRLAVIALLGAVAGAAGLFLIRRMTSRLRATGTAGLA
jgi:ABC-2 type transport system permease protein